MKPLLAFLIVIATFQHIHANESPISCGFRLQDGEDFLSSPNVTAKPGESFEIAVTREYTQEPGLMLPMGVILKGKTKWIDGRIHYSLILTIRDSTEYRGDDDTHKFAAFKTDEYLLSGSTVAGSELPTELTNGKKVTLMLSQGNK